MRTHSRIRKILIATAVIAITTGLAGPTALAQSPAYPAKTVRIVINYTPGGPSDLVARYMAAKMGEIFGQSFVVDNMPSANGAIGTLTVARAAPDGHTLLISSAGHTSLAAALYTDKLPFDPFRDMAPVGMLLTSTQMIVTHPSLNIKTIAELVKVAKSRPGQINYGSVGVGSPNHMGIELMKSMAGIDMLHVPYKGTSQVMQDLVAGRVQLMLNSMATVVPFTRSGKLVPLAVGSPARSSAAPDVPTMIESGFPGFEVSTWWAMFAPNKTPTALIARLNSVTHQVLADAQLAKTFSAQGAEPAGSTPEFLTKLMREEYDRWRKVIADAKIVAEQDMISKNLSLFRAW